MNSGNPQTSQYEAWQTQQTKMLAILPVLEHGKTTTIFFEPVIRSTQSLDLIEALEAEIARFRLLE